MLIVEIIKPGSSVVNDDFEKEARIFQSLNAIVSNFYQANMALNLFEKALIDFSSNMSKNFEPQEHVMERRRRAEGFVRNELGLDPIVSFDEFIFEVKKIENRERWSEENLPFDLTSHIPEIYAQAFLHSCDSINKILKSLTHDKLLPQKVEGIHRQFKEEFPDLEGVRNSLQHQEQRLKMERMRKGVTEKIEPKPFDIGVVKSSGNALIGKGLIGNIIISTMENGVLGKIEVSRAALLKIAELIQTLLYGFEWTGQKQVLPR